MRRFLLAVALGVLFVLVAPAFDPGTGEAESARPPEGDDRLLVRAGQVYASLTTLRARFTQTIEMRVFEPPKRREGRGVWMQARDGRVRMDFARPEGDLVVSDGRRIWMYQPSLRPGQVVCAELGGAPGAGPLRPARLIERLRRHYDVVERGEETLAGGHRSHHLTLEAGSGRADYRRVELWLDAERLWVRRVQLVDRSETVRTLTWADIETDVTISDQVFRFAVPDGADVFCG